MLSVAIVLSGPFAAPVHAADDDDDEESIETKFIKGSARHQQSRFASIIANARRWWCRRISNRLPAPETNALVNSPAWPKNPEDVERKKRAAAQKTQRRRSVEEDNRALTPAELNVVGPKAGAGRAPTPTGPQDAEAEGRRMMRPDELGTKGSLLGGLFKDTSKPEVAKFDREPTACRPDPAAARLPDAVGRPSLWHLAAAGTGKAVRSAFGAAKAN